MSGKEDPIIQEIVSLHKENNHLAILELLKKVARDKELIANLHLVTWPVPAARDLEAFANFIISHEIPKMYSVGCGTGLLEWLMYKFVIGTASMTGKTFEINGIEIDSQWWKSAYSPPAFIPLKFVGEDFSSQVLFGGSNDLVLFCYFNNIFIFKEYLEAFQGSYVILIGPISTVQYCAPGPLELKENAELPTDAWTLESCRQFGLVDIDFIAVYKRKLVTVQ